MWMYFGEAAADIEKMTIERLLWWHAEGCKAMAERANMSGG